MQQITFDKKDIVGYIMYYHHANGVVIVEYSLETTKKDFDPEEFIKKRFKNRTVEILDEANIWT